MKNQRTARKIKRNVPFVFSEKPHFLVTAIVVGNEIKPLRQIAVVKMVNTLFHDVIATVFQLGR